MVQWYMLFSNVIFQICYNYEKFKILKIWPKIFFGRQMLFYDPLSVSCSYGPFIIVSSSPVPQQYLSPCNVPPSPQTPFVMVLYMVHHVIMKDYGVDLGDSFVKPPQLR